MADINNIGYNIDGNNLVKVLKSIHKKMAMKKNLLGLIKKNQIRNNL